MLAIGDQYTDATVQRVVDKLLVSCYCDPDVREELNGGVILNLAPGTGGTTFPTTARSHAHLTTIKTHTDPRNRIHNGDIL